MLRCWAAATQDRANPAWGLPTRIIESARARAAKAANLGNLVNQSYWLTSAEIELNILGGQPLRQCGAGIRLYHGEFLKLLSLSAHRPERGVLGLTVIMPRQVSRSKW